MKLNHYLILTILPFALYGCSQELSASPPVEVEEITNTAVTDVNLEEDVTRFTELFVRFQSISNVETATKNQAVIKNAVKDDYEEVVGLLEKYVSYLKTANVDTEMASDFELLLTSYVDGLDYYIEGIEYNQPSLTAQAFENFVSTNSLLEDLTDSFGIPFSVGVQESQASEISLLENTTLKKELESSFGKEIVINNVSYEKFNSVNQYELNDESVLSLEVITDSLDQAAIENYGSREYIHKEMKNILDIAFKNQEIDKVGLTFILDFNGTLLPTYSVSFIRENFVGLDFDINDFDFVIGFFGVDFSQENISQSYTVIDEGVDETNEATAVMEPVIKEETTEEKEFYNILLQSTQDYWGEMNATEWEQSTYDEKVLLVEEWILNYQNLGGEINEDPEWFVYEIDATCEYFGTSIAENGETLYVLVGDVIFQYVAFEGIVSPPF